MSTRPRIAMPVRLSDGSADPRIEGANRIFEDVAALADAAGLEVVRVTGAEIDGFDGVVLPGGGDVDPARYGGRTIDALYDVNPDQDALDFALAGAARTAGIPILGVCRGLQVLNVLYGGTLIEDLPPTSVVHTDTEEPGCTDILWSWHEVTLAPGSLLQGRVGTASMTVASGHHQGIGRLGAGLVATAVADDGLVEAFEHERDGVIAVQWHPEAQGTPADLAAAPFTAFAAVVRARRGAGA